MEPYFFGNMQNMQNMQNIPNFNWMFGINPAMLNPMFNNQMIGMNFSQNDVLGLVYGAGANTNQNNQNNQNSPGKINIIFKTTQNVRTPLTVELNKTLSDTILLYLKRVNKPELFAKDSGICFIYNAKKLDIYDKTPVGVLFVQPYPIIMVTDVLNLIGA